MVMINRHRTSEFLNDEATEWSLLLAYGSNGPATKGWGSQDRLRNVVLERFVNKERMRWEGLVAHTAEVRSGNIFVRKPKMKERLGYWSASRHFFIIWVVGSYVDENPHHGICRWVDYWILPCVVFAYKSTGTKKVDV